MQSENGGDDCQEDENALNNIDRGINGEIRQEDRKRNRLNPYL